MQEQKAPSLILGAMNAEMAPPRASFDRPRKGLRPVGLISNPLRSLLFLQCPAIDKRHVLRRSRRWEAVVAGVMFAAVSLGAESAGDTDRVSLLDGAVVEGRVTGIGEGDTLRVDGRQDPIELQDVRAVVRPKREVKVDRHRFLVHLLGDGCVGARGVTIADQECTIRWAYGDKWALPLKAIRAVIVVPEKGNVPTVDAWRIALDDKKSTSDVLFVHHKEAVQPVVGTLESLTPEKAVFVWGDSSQDVDVRKKMYGVVLAQLVSDPDLSGLVLVRLRDGSRLWGTPVKLEKERLRFLPVGGAETDLPWDAVARLDVRSSRVAFLSDMEPENVVEEAIATFPGPWRRDLSVLGNPMRLGESSFEKGLGVHARCVLTYRCDGRYRAFAATVGIDAETKGKGDCVFLVKGDGKTLFEKRVRGTDEPASVNVPLDGVKRLTLAVEPGENLDLADHGNWCDARLIVAE